MSSRAPKGFAVLLLVAELMALLIVALHPAAAAAKTNAKKASVISEQAMKLHFAGRFAAAEALFREANKLDPNPGYLYSAARAAHKGGQLTAALRDYRMVMTQHAGTPFAVKAKVHHDKLVAQEAARRETAEKRAAAAKALAQQKAEEAAAAAQERAKAAKLKQAEVAARQRRAVAAAAHAERQRWKTLGAFGVGATATVVGVALAVMWQEEKADWDERPRFDGKVVGEIDEVQASARSMNNKLLGTYIAGGVGLVGLGLGAYWLFNNEAPRVAFAPARGGGVLTVRVAFDEVYP